MTTRHYILVKTTEKSKKGVSYRHFGELTGKSPICISMRGKIKNYVKINAIDYCCEHSDYNGYGYTHHDWFYLLTPQKYKKIKEIQEAKEATPQKSEQQKIEEWCRRLVKLTEITIEEAQAIALEKLNAQTDQINSLIERDNNRGASKRRRALINKIRRSNPLRRIENEDHARAILAASYRHNNTNYEAMLDEYREQAERGEIDFEDVKPMARAAIADDMKKFSV